MSRPKAASRSRRSKKQNQRFASLVSMTTFRRSSRRCPTQISHLFRWPQHFENLPVRARKSQLAQLRQRTPASIFKRPRRPVCELDAIDIHRDPVARDRVAHLMERRNGEWTRVEKIFRERPTLRSAPIQFDIWEFPELGVDCAGRTSADEETSRFLDDEGGKSALS